MLKLYNVIGTEDFSYPGIEGSYFRDFLNICFKRSTHFSFTQNHIEEYAKSIEHAKFLEELSQYHVKTIQTRRWFGYSLPENKKERKIYLFRAEKEAQSIIQKHFNSIFLREFDEEKFSYGDYKSLPEDLCFFAEKTLIVGTLSCSEICYVFPTSEQFKKEVLTTGYWRLFKGEEKEQMILKG